jgi:hypothetical protein
MQSAAREDWHEGIHHRRHRVLAHEASLVALDLVNAVGLTVAIAIAGAISAVEASSLLYFPAWA